MSVMSDLHLDIVDMLEQGKTVTSIAKSLSVPVELVQDVADNYDSGELAYEQWLSEQNSMYRDEAHFVI